MNETSSIPSKLQTKHETRKTFPRKSMNSKNKKQKTH